MILETVAGGESRFDYAATENKVVGCAWLTSLHQFRIEMIRQAVIRHPEYRFLARIDRWIDGDTAEITVFLGSRFAPIDVGFGIVHKIGDEYAGIFRLSGINAPERHATGGSAATEMAKALAPEGTEIEILTSKDPDSFGRYVAELWTNEYTSVNQAMIASGHAVIYPSPKKTQLPK